MTEKTMVQIPHEGDTFSLDSEGTGDNTSTESQAENNELNNTQSAEGDDENSQQQNQTDKNNQNDEDDENSENNQNVPLHEHPRWKARENEWKDRFNEQEERHQKDRQSILEKINGLGNSNKDNVGEKQPSWFGGTSEQWQEFQEWNKSLIKNSQETILTKINEEKKSEYEAVKKATEYMEGQIKEIQKSKELNPDGKTVDANKLVKFVIDNHLVDSEGHWNYRLGWQFMNQSSANKSGNTQQKKNLANATISKTHGEAKPSNFKTSKDFQNDKPW